MRTRGQIIVDRFLKEVDIDSAPMSADDKTLALTHFKGLGGILDQEDPLKLAACDSKAAAWDRLARMTVASRRFRKRYAGMKIDDEHGGLLYSLLHAGFSSQGVDSDLRGEAQEVAALLQDFQTGNVDDVIELWNASPKDEALPESRAFEHTGEEIDWTRVLCRSYSEDNLLQARAERSRSSTGQHGPRA